MSEPKRYEIKSIEDIVDKVPLDKLSDFLEDFGTWIAYRKTVIRTGKALGLNVNHEEFRKMTWIDDGKHDVTIRTTIKRATKINVKEG